MKIKTIVWDYPDYTKTIFTYISVGMLMISLTNVTLAMYLRSWFLGITNLIILLFFILIVWSSAEHSKIEKKIKEINLI